MNKFFDIRAEIIKTASLIFFIYIIHNFPLLKFYLSKLLLCYI